jgi:nicotinamide-nucleotide amidase
MSEPALNTVAVVLVGDELLIGHTSDTNGPWLGRRLTDRGFRVVSATVAPDDVHAVVVAVERGLADARAVLVTGGLGVTSDDVTRTALARVFAGLEPAKLPNPVGSESGACFDRGTRVVYAMPGVPAEMRAIVDNQVLPELVAAAGALAERAARSLVVVGMSEPQIAKLLAPVEADLAGQGGRLTYLPRPAEVEVRIVATLGNAETVVTTATVQARELLGDVVAAENQRLEEAIVTALRTRRRTVAVAESLTGGLVAASLISVAGASEVIRGAVVAYATDLKADLLDVPAEMLEGDGAVAVSTAQAMAHGVRSRCRADFGVATTGVAGPDSQEGHPPGTMHLAVASDDAVRIASFEPFAQHRDRDTVRRIAVVRALDLLRRTVRGLGSGTGESPPQPTR